MGRLKPTAAAGKAGRSVSVAAWLAKAKTVKASLQAEYEAGKQGDDTPAVPIWATPQQQLDALVALFKRDGDAESDGQRDASDAPSADTDARSAYSDATDAADVAEAIRGVDWASVRAATADRTAEATTAMRSMAEQVDWAKVQPVAAQVSSALIAAIATGRLGVGGRLASTVARAMTNQGGLGQRVAAELDETPTDLPIDFRTTIEAVARDVTPT